MRTLLLALLCTGCTSFVPSTLLHVARVNPLTADPASYAVYLALPPGAGIVPGSATLTFSGTKSDDNTVSTETYVLQTNGMRYAINPADYTRMRTQQAMLLAWENGPGVDGDMAIDLTPCRVGDGPAPDATVSIDIQLAADGPRMPLIRKAPVAKLGVDSLPLCPHIPR